MEHQSPVPNYPGYIVLPDVFGWDDLIAWDEEITKAGETDSVIQMRLHQQAAVLSVVKEWHIEKLPEHPEKLPANIGGVRLISWVIALVKGMMAMDGPDPFLSGVSGTTSTGEAA